jgi:hypothetical protein
VLKDLRMLRADTVAELDQAVDEIDRCGATRALCRRRADHAALINRLDEQLDREGVSP